MKKSQYILVISTLLLGLLPVAAQQSETGYFMEDNLYRHDMNPAFGNARGYFALPGLGSMSMGFGSTMGLDNFLFIKDGKTVTFMHPDVSNDEFLSGLEDKNRLQEDARIQLLGLGLKSEKKEGRYTTFEVNLRQHLQATVPGDLFELAKLGLQNRTYDLSDLQLHGEAYAEMALGRSFQYKDKWRFGAKVKFLVGGGMFDLKFDKADLRLSGDGYEVETQGEAHVAVKGFQYQTTTEDYKAFENNQMVTRTRSYIDDVDVDSPGANGFGGAIDLGAVCRLSDAWQFSASVEDLGFISWKEDHVARTAAHVNTIDYDISLDDADYNKLDNTVDVLVDDLAQLYQFQPESDGGSCRRRLTTTARLGAEYTTPFYKQLKFGVLGTARFAEEDVWTDVRLMANVAPVKMLSVAASAGIGTFGATYGGCLNLHLLGVNMFLAADCISDSFTEDMIPVSANASFSFGMNVLL